MHLDWSINFQFAGLLWAREKGLLAASGPDVRLVPTEENPDRTTLDLVLAGECRVGCMEDNLIVCAVVAGEGVKAIGATMQDLPIHLVTLPECGMACLADVAGRRIAMHRDGVHLLEKVLELHGIDPGSMRTAVEGWSSSISSTGPLTPGGAVPRRSPPSRASWTRSAPHPHTP